MSGKNQVTRARMTSREGWSRAPRLVRRIFKEPAQSLATLAIAASVAGVWFQAVAAPPGAPQANRIFANCTFTTADLQSILNIPNSSLNKFATNQIQASYILIYVRQNRNDGQQLDGTPATFTGPVLCINADSEVIDQTTETTAIPNSTNHPGTTSVDILGTEEAFHLQYQLNPPAVGGDIEKRVCHTAATNTDCFFIQPK
jgi:hypothetical protein